MYTNRVRLLWFAVVLFVLSALPVYASGVRIVRLSLAQGDVQIDRNSGDGWEQAINNMPVIGGARVYAAENAKAELEFEDGSSVRLAGPAQISVVELTSSADGKLVNVIQVTSGEVYVNARLHHHDDFRIVAPTGESFAITKPSHLRFTVDQQTASLAMMDGEAVVQASQRDKKVRSGETFNYVLGQPDSAASLNSVPRQPDDSWNQQRDSYNDQYASAGAQFSGSDDPNAAGVADLGAYGSYSDLPGYGVAWQPNGVGADWSPFDYGAWSYYPGWGWTFVSGYNWGWAPFFYGDWCFVGGRGWWWRPGPWHGPGRGGGWHPQPRLTGHPGGNFNAPHPPARGTHGTVAVAGSHLPVGPIGATHAPGATHGFVRSSPAGAPTGGPIGRVGANSNLIRGQVVSNFAGPSIVGQKGSYAVTGTGAARNGHEVNRPPAGSMSHPSSNLSRPAAGAPAGGAPRSYAYPGGSSAPRAYAVPSAPSVSSAPHVSSGGGVVHSSGGGGGGGGFHGGGGGGGGSHSGGGHR
jgi:hypothetical protein